MRKLLMLLALVATQPAYATTHSYDFEMRFGGESFFDVFDNVKGLPMGNTGNGAPFGFSGPYSHLKPGDLATASVTMTEDFGLYEVTSCTFAGEQCGGQFVELDPGKSLAIMDLGQSYVFDLETGSASFFQTAFGQSATGSFRAYGADFQLVQAPVPFSAALLLSGFALLGLNRRRRT